MSRDRHAAHHPGAPLLEVEDLTVRFGRHRAIEGVSFALEAGANLAVLGPNGAGKSTLFKAVAGIVPTAQGRIRVYGSGPGRHTCIAYLPQRSEVDFTFPVTVLDVALMGCASERGVLCRPRARDRDWAVACLEVVGLGGLARRQIGELSGGQQQRLFIARALAQRAELALLDEPAAGLDLRAQRELPGLLGRLRERGVTVLMAGHDLAFARAHFDRILLLNRRRVALGPPDAVLTPPILAEAFEGQVHLVETPAGAAAVLSTHDDGGGRE